MTLTKDTYGLLKQVMDATTEPYKAVTGLSEEEKKKADMLRFNAPAEDLRSVFLRDFETIRVKDADGNDIVFINGYSGTLIADKNRLVLSNDGDLHKLFTADELLENGKEQL